MIGLQSRRARLITGVIFALALLPTLVFGLRTYHSYLLLRSAYAAGAPVTSSIRGWMTLDYLAAAYHTPEATLLERLGLDPTTEGNSSLKSLADRAGVSPPRYLERVQRAVAEGLDRAAPAAAEESSGWLASLADRTLSALLAYGYPALGATLLLGAIGLPLPDGIATAIAGSLAAQGRMDWFWASVIVVTASVLGDLVGYGIGRLLDAELVERRLRWLGYSAARRLQVQALFDQWGLVTVFLTRTFVSYLSSVASLLAGVARYQLPRFLGVAVAGRLIWTAAYLGLGYAVGSDLDAAASFLTNLSLLLLLLTISAASGLIATGQLPGNVPRRGVAAN